MQIAKTRLEGVSQEQVRAPSGFHTLIIAERHHLVACRMEEVVCVWISATGFPTAVSQAVLLKGLLQCLQLRLWHVARDRTTLEVFDDLRLETLIDRAIVHTLAIRQLPVLVALFDVLRDVGLELVIVHRHHGKARLTTILGNIRKDYLT